MSAFPRAAKFFLIGSALLLTLLALLLIRPPQVNTTPDQATPYSEGWARNGWTCDWLGEPTIIHGAVRNQCSGAVQCRHRTMRTFFPQIRKVTCPTLGNACGPAACFTRSTRTP